MNITLTYLCRQLKHFKSTVFKVFNLERINTHGGSLRLWISKSPKIINNSVKKERMSEIKEKYLK